MFRLIFLLLFIGTAQAAVYQDQKAAGEHNIFFFNDEKGPIACIQPLGEGEDVRCWRPGDVKYICKQEEATLGTDMVWRGFISNCKKKEWSL